MGFIAITGDTWDQDQPKIINRLTLTGKLAAALLMVSFSLGVIKEYIDFQERQKKIDSEQYILLTVAHSCCQRLSLLQKCIKQQ